MLAAPLFCPSPASAPAGSVPVIVKPFRLAPHPDPMPQTTARSPACMASCFARARACRKRSEEAERLPRGTAASRHHAGMLVVEDEDGSSHHHQQDERREQDQLQVVAM